MYTEVIQSIYNLAYCSFPENVVFRYYFIIGIEFKPDSVELSEQTIVDTVINNFELLLPTDDLINHNLGL